MSGRNGGNGSEVVAKICKVCEGKATGFHFGVMSCEGCKGFFRRNVKKNARFICNYDKNCDVKGEKRKNCQACRMARCESSGMRRDRIMMTERRKNRRTEEKKARLAAEAAAKSEVEAAAVAANIKHEIPDSTPITQNVPKSSILTIVKKEVPEPDSTPSIEDIKQERCEDPSPQPVISNQPTDNSQSSSFQNGSEESGTFHPAQFRPEQTTIQLPQQKDFQQPLQITDQFSQSFNNSLNQHPINQTNAFNYQHMINQYIPGYQPPTSPNPNPIEDIIRNPNQSNNSKLEPTNPIWNKFWNSVPKNESIGSPSSPNSNPTAIPAKSPKTVLNRTNSTNELPWNNNLEMPLASGIRARNESSLGSPSSPTSVSRNSLSGSSSIDDILLARKKTINTEMTHIKEARHASFISRHIREKRQMDELDRTSINRMLPYSILDVERNYANTSDWLDNCEDPTENPVPVNPVNQHQPLTTPNGSVVGSEKKSHSHKMDSQSGEDSFSTDRRKHEKYTEFFADLMECGVKEIVSYCKLIPEFYSLAMADQEYLLRSTILELLILKCYFNYKDGEFLNGVNGIWLRREDFIIATKDVSFIDNLMQLMQKMASLDMTEEDVLLLMLVTLFNHDSPGSLAQNREQISISKKYFVSKMMDHMNKSENNIHMKDRGTECLLLLPLLSTLNNSFMDILAGLSIQHSRTVDLGPISTLIYELKPELKDKDTRRNDFDHRTFCRTSNLALLNSSSRMMMTGDSKGSSRSGLRRSLSRTSTTVPNRNKSFIKYAKLGDDKNLLNMLRTSRAQPDWEHEGESALVAASSKAQIKCVNELIKAGAEVNQRDSNGSIPICAVSDVPIIGFGTRLNEYRSGQDVDKMARTVTVLDMLINQGSLLISRDNDNRTPLDLARIHNNWPAYLILRLNDNHAFNDELKSIVTYFLDVFEKMKVTDLNSIKLHMIHFSATNNIEGMVNLLDMFDDTEETWFPFWYKFALYVCEARLKHRQLSNTKRGELVELVELLKGFKTNFKNGFLSSDEEMEDGSRRSDSVISEAEAVQKIAKLQIRSNELESLNRRTERSIESLRTSLQQPTSRFKYSSSLSSRHSYKS